MKLLAEEKYTRAWPGGTGDAKVGGYCCYSANLIGSSLHSNYALSIKPAAEAAAKGYTQVLWLIGEPGYVTEVGTMNMFVFWKNKQGMRAQVAIVRLFIADQASVSW